MEPDFRLMMALQLAQQNFAVSDPSLPDNPIVYASKGFLQLTGYTMSQVIGRNCRFLQGPGTDPKAVDIIREGVSSHTTDMTASNEERREKKERQDGPSARAERADSPSPSPAR